MKKLKVLILDYDPILWVSLLILSLLGLLGVYSATYKGGTSPLFFKQLIYLLVGWFVIALLSRFNFRVLLDMAPGIYLFNLFLLTLVPIVGKTVYGAKRWLDLGPVSLQPSELMKFSLLLFLVYTFSHARRLWSKEVFVGLFSLTVPFFLTLKQPDLGTALTFILIFAVVLFLWGLKVLYFILAGISLLASAPLLWHLLKDYQKERILAVIDPYSDYQGSGYQLIQSVIAVGSGGMFGKGFLQGTQSHLLFLPEKHTDFIFSVISEEWGLMGSFILVSVFFLIFYGVLKYSLLSTDHAERLFLGALGTLWIFQVSVNFLMTMGLMPVVGMPLPFVSYGGSAILTFSLLLGTALSIIREQRNRSIRFEHG
ncbi:MAG: rod shape-determining protein RodA [Acidobacteria bacterium]|jgi:rod shape determining protein RodA|nr:MAG: rod shape-determining protein RodA [Acidobacteriota bacterium]